MVQFKLLVAAVKDKCIKLKLPPLAYSITRYNVFSVSITSNNFTIINTQHTHITKWRHSITEIHSSFRLKILLTLCFAPFSGSDMLTCKTFQEKLQPRATKSHTGLRRTEPKHTPESTNTCSRATKSHTGLRGTEPKHTPESTNACSRDTKSHTGLRGTELKHTPESTVHHINNRVVWLLWLLHKQ